MSEEMFNKLLSRLETVGGRGWELLVEAEFYSGLHQVFLAAVFFAASAGLLAYCVRLYRYNCSLNFPGRTYGDPSPKRGLLKFCAACFVVCTTLGLWMSFGLRSVLAPGGMALRGLIG